MLLKLPEIKIEFEIAEKLEIYKTHLLKWQKSVNLVSPNSLENTENRHFQDSLQIAGLVSREAKIYDIGSGAGFPGLVLASIGYNCQLIESDLKKCEFLKNVSREANIPVIIHNKRVENVDISPPDFVTSRALADLIKLLNLTEKWWSKNKNINLIFLKGSRALQEIDEAKKFFQFDCDVYQSNTDPSGRILKLTNINRIS